MKIKETVLGIAVLALVAAGLWLWLGDGAVERAPAISFTTLDGRSIDLEDLEGRPVMINFWATSCVGCHREMPIMTELYEKYRDRGFELIAVAFDYDPPEQVKTVVAKKALPYPIVLDSDGSIARAFGDVKLAPTTLLIDRRGRIVLRKLGEFDPASIEQRIADLVS